MKQKTRKPKLANIGYVGTEIITAQSANTNVGDTAIQSRTSEVDYKQKFEQQKEEIQALKDDLSLKDTKIEHLDDLSNHLKFVHSKEIHRLNSQVGGYKKNLNDSKDTIKALTADVNELKGYVSELKAQIKERDSQIKERDIKINKQHQIINGLQLDVKQSNEDYSNQLDTTQRLAKKLQSIQSKWWYKLFN